MIINKEGTINIQNLGIIISPDFTVDDLKNTKHSEYIQYSDGSGGYDRYVLTDMLIDGLPFGGLFVFYNYKIAQILITYSGLKSKITSGILLEQGELIKKQHDKLLLAQYGATKIKFTWGTIRSVRDLWDDGARIIITYNNCPIKGSDFK